MNRKSIFGIVPSNWSFGYMEDVSDLSQGLQFAKKDRFSLHSKDRIPLLKIADMCSGNYSEYVLQSKVPESCLSTNGDLIYTRTGQVGLIFKDLDGCVHNNCFKILFYENKITKDYLYYYLNNDIAKKYSNFIASGSVQKDLTHKSFKKFPIGYPSIKEQKKIADLLSSIDDKIEINNKINQELEELGQALYTKWFVNFDFPNEEGKPYRSSGGEMIESELGMIPKGWKVDNILSIFNFEKGVEPGSNNYTNNKDDIRFIRVKDMETTSPDVYVSEDTMGTKKLKYISSKDIVISLDGTIGKVFVGNEGCISSGIRIIKLKDYEYMIDYTYLFAKSNYLINSLTGGSSGSVIKHAGGRLNDLTIVHPNTDTLLKFQNSYNGIVEMIIQNRIENKKLEELRDFLIPQLMSGNLEIKDIEN